MFSNHRCTNRILALFSFLIALLLYFLTMAPTVSFWDSGEFIAVAHGLQVNHPPGAPFYSLLGRLFSMFIPAGYVAASINFLSVLCSAFTVMLLYLISVRLIRELKDHPDAMSETNTIVMYGGSLLGALTFAVTDTFWFNAVEAEVYAVSMFFTALVVWLALVWAEDHEDTYSERWIILIAYLFGIALGIHLLNLLALFFVALIIYFKKFTFGWRSFGILIALSTLSFLLIYPFTIQSIPAIMEWVAHTSYGLIGPLGFIIMVIIIFSSAIYYTHKNNYRMANIVVLCYTMILIGYSSYALIFIRSNADPPIDENDPETVESFISYLEREQYGDTPLLTGYTYDNAMQNIDRDEEVFFPRRYSSRPQHVQQYRQYSSDWDYFIDYQLNHMYWRYFAWNFIGRDADIQDAGWQSGFTETKHEDNPAHNSYYFIPFILGLLGMLYHFKHDWKRALSVSTLFIFTGIAIIVYLNQTPMEPRERDYAYVGSFFAFSIWIGMGGAGLIEWITQYLKPQKWAAYGMLGILFCASPILMGVQNYHDSDRSTRYVAADYAYNLLNSTAPNAILFTNGDNDTFPLWYLQEVEGVRTDVRIVNLSLLNTDWYIKQLRDEWSHESPPLPISLSDDEIREITEYPLHNPDTLTVPVEKEFLKKAFSGDRQYKEAMGVNPDTSLTIFDNGIEFGIPTDSLDNVFSMYVEGQPVGEGPGAQQRYVSRVQDEVIIDILKTNRWLRPIYFANTIPRENQLNLQPYFRMEGNTYRVVPQRHEANGFGWINSSIHSSRLENFQFRKWNDADTYLDENIRGMINNYRKVIIDLASKLNEENKTDKAIHWLEWGEERLPFNAFQTNVSSILQYAFHYTEVGNSKQALSLADQVERQIMKSFQQELSELNDIRKEIRQVETNIQKARNNAEVNQQKQLQGQLQTLKSTQENIGRRLSAQRTNLIIVQYIFFSTDQNNQASELADQVANTSNGLINLPASKNETEKLINQVDL